MTRLPGTALLLGAVVLAACTAAPKPAAGPSGPDRAALAARVKEEFLFSWRAYERYAWGHDELKPLTRTPHDWYGETPS